MKQDQPPARDIAVIGCLNIDMILGPLSNLPAWGTESVVSEMSVRSAGAAGNTAFALAELGASTCVVGSVGDDEWGQRILCDLKVAGVDTAHVRVIGGVETGLCVAVTRADGERAFTTFLGAMRRFDNATLKESAANLLDVRWALLTGTFVLPALTWQAIEACFIELRSRGICIAWDPGWDPQGWHGETVDAVRSLLKHVDVFLPNAAEGEALTGPDDVIEQCAILLGYGADTVVIKNGSHGAVAANASELYQVPARTVQAKDTTGAGDIFNGAILYALCKGLALQEATSLGCTAAERVLSSPENRYAALRALHGYIPT